MNNRIFHQFEKLKKKVQGYKEPDPNIQKEYHHKIVLNDMIKAIWMSPLHDEVKMFMIFRLWGTSPLIFYPLTLREAAFIMLDHQPSDKELEAMKQMEEFGVIQMQTFLKSVAVEELVSKYNEKYDKNKSDIFTQQKFEKKRFEV